MSGPLQEPQNIYDDPAFLAGYSTLERLWERPTLEVNGVRGGGKYTVIPHLAVANVSCRLVPGQDPARVARLIVTFAKKHNPDVVAEVMPGGCAASS